MMEFFAVIGAINVMLAACIALVLPIVLALWVSPIWLIAYILYFILVGVFACIMAGSDADRRSSKIRKPGDKDERVE